MAQIPILGLASSDPVPGNYVQVEFAQGPASAGQTNYTALLYANKLSTGSGSINTVYGPDTPVQLNSEQDVIDLAGAGSEAHRMFRRFKSINKSSSMYMIFMEEATGAQADGYIGLEDSNAEADSAGTIRMIIGDTLMDVGFATGAGLADIAQDLVDAINERTELPVTAAVSGFGVEITAKQVGVRGNEIRYSAQVIPATGTGITVTPTARTAMANGSGNDDIEDALDVVEGDRFYYQVVPHSDSTNLGDLGAQIDADAQPLVGNRNRWVSGSVDTLANTITLATGRNQARGEIVWQENSDWTPAELAAHAAGVYMLFETALSGKFGMNFNGFGADGSSQQFWRVPKPLDGTSVPRASVKSALLNGISPIVPQTGGGTYLAKRITTRSLNGSTPDYRIRDAHKVTVADRFADDLLAKANLQLGGRTIADDPQEGQTVANALAVTPSVFKNMIVQLINQYDNQGLLQNVADILSGLQVVRETSPTTRLSARIPLQVIDILNQTGSRIEEVSAG